MPAAKTRPIRPASCSCCSHPERVRLEALFIAGGKLRPLAKEFGVGKDAIARHMKAHVSEKRKAELLAGPAKIVSLADAAAREEKSVLDHLNVQLGILSSAQLNAAESGDWRAVAALGGRIVDAAFKKAEITGQLRQAAISITNNTINLVASPAFVELRSGLLEIVRKHPDVKGDVVALLRRLDTPSAAVRSNGAAHSPPMIESEALHVA